MSVNFGPVRRAILVLAVLATARTATATPYETFVDVGDQADLEDLFAAGDITADTFEELLELLGAGVDLSTADRAQLYTLPNLTYDDVDGILKYREQHKGAIEDPATLVAAGVLSEDKLLAISAFLVVSRTKDRYNIKGWVRFMTRYSGGPGVREGVDGAGEPTYTSDGFVHDDLLPPFALRGRFTMLKHVQAGFAAAFTRLDVGAPVYDPARDALISDPADYKFELPKLFVKYEDDEAAIIAGTYRVGFAQRLVFDNSSRYTPNGLYIDDDLQFSADLTRACRQSTGELAASPCSDDHRYVTPDWRWRDGLFGVAAGFKKLEIGGAGWLQGYIWSSLQNRKIYQYELVDRGKCPDPSDDTNAACTAPDVFVRPKGNLLQQTPEHSFSTLPDVFQERLAGVNVTYFADRRNSVGLTAYAASITNLVDGVDLDTQEWSRIPTGGRYGAAGASFSFGRSWLDVFGEAAFSYDRIPDSFGPQEGGGGGAAILRVTATKKKQELEASLRYYGIDYVNPYARPIAQPDTLDGQRARDEAGIRLRYYRTEKLFSIRALLDLWEPPSQRDATQLGRSQPKLDSYVRTDFRTTEQLRLGLWLRFQDKDLSAGGNNQCFEVSTEEDENGEPIPCAGRQLTTIVRARYAANKKLAWTVMLEHQLVDDPVVSDTAFRQDWAGWLIAHWNPSPGVRVRGRVRYLEEAIGAKNNSMPPTDIGETSINALIDTAFKLRTKDTLRIRTDFKFFLDDRTSSLEREPSPEMQLWFTYEAKL